MVVGCLKGIRPPTVRHLHHAGAAGRKLATALAATAMVSPSPRPNPNAWIKRIAVAFTSLETILATGIYAKASMCIHHLQAANPSRRGVILAHRLHRRMAITVIPRSGERLQVQSAIAARAI